MHDIGKNIRILRIQKHMTQDALAEKLFVTRQTVSNYEVGKTRPDIQTLMQIAEILHVDLNEILYGPEDAAARRNKLIRIVLGLLAMAILGFLLNRLIDYSILMQLEHGPALNIFSGLVIQPAYFFLLGWYVTSSIRSLQHVPTFSPAVNRYIRAGVIGLTALLLLVLFPYYSVMLSSFGIPYVRVPPFWMNITHVITRELHFIWISLLLGAIWGLSFSRKK